VAPDEGVSSRGVARPVYAAGHDPGAGPRGAELALSAGEGPACASGRLLSASTVPALRTHLPNALTIARFALIPLFVVLMLEAEGGHSWAAGIVFGVAAITDQVDGWLARRWHVESEFGKYADPLADRLMIDAAVLLLVLDDRLPWAALVIVVGRDVLLIAGSRVIEPRGYEFSVSFLGKLATWVLYAAIAAIIVTPSEEEWPLWLFWSGVGLSIVAGVAYVVGAWRAISR
jgi:CDP-diacylglycerol--glycerol-3-phosphate 3-phosphatidyltransferase